MYIMLLGNTLFFVHNVFVGVHYVLDNTLHCSQQDIQLTTAVLPLTTSVKILSGLNEP